MNTNNTLANYIDDVVLKFGEREAIVFPENNIRYTYKAFKSLYDNIATTLLRLGVKKGDHVAIWALNSSEWIALQIATAKIGAVLICLNSNYNKMELKYALNHSDSTTLFLEKSCQDMNFLDILFKICPELKSCEKGKLKSENIPKLKNIILLNTFENNEDEYSKNIYNLSTLLAANNNIYDNLLEKTEIVLDCNDIVNIQYTSGTTGNPKAVMITNYALLNNAIKTGEEFQYNENERLLLCLPLFHVMGCILSAIVCLTFGATIVVVKKFKTSTILKILEAEQCTAINAVPAMFNFLLEHEDFNKYDLSSLKKGMIAGSLCSKKLLSQIVNKMGMSGLTIIYGQTEALSITALSYVDDDNQIITVGSGLASVLTKVIDSNTGEELPYMIEGELCTKSPYLMKGYYKDELSTRKAIDEDGWLHTGDLATKHKDGCVQLKGRLKDNIIRGGENISPLEIEEFLNTHNSIKDCSVIGVPDKHLGEAICLFVILKEGHSMDVDEIKNHIKENLAKYKTPKYIEIVSVFPMTSSGKIKKFILKEIIIKKYNLEF